MLTWQEDGPCFIAKGFAGDKMGFHFGCTNIDDIEVTEFILEIELSEHQGVWSVETRWHQYNDRSQKPQVGVFLSKLKLVVKMHKNFDFRIYLNEWSRKDPHFAAVIHNRTGDTQEHLRIR